MQGTDNPLEPAEGSARSRVMVVTAYVVVVAGVLVGLVTPWALVSVLEFVKA